MSWKKYVKPVNTVLPVTHKPTGADNVTSKYASWLPEVYQGPIDRLQRYVQYEQMAMDHDVSAALDTIAEFCTQQDTATGTPFVFDFSSDPSNSEMMILNRALKQWCNINDFNRRMFRIFRSTLMYGDQFLIRDPKSFKLYWVDPNFVEKVVVNESKGKKIETYYIKELDLNHQSLVASSMAGSDKGGFTNKPNAMPLNRAANTSMVAQGTSAAYFSGTQSQTSIAMPVNAEFVVHASLSEGLDSAWPFGISELETVFKIFKQKSMLEDAMLIYRIHRAPERRVFNIDVGDMPPTQAAQYLEQIKYQVQQKRIPSLNGNGSNTSDVATNPLSSLEDYYFAVGPDGRGSTVTTLPGGEGLNSINDMLYFNNRMFRALGIPSSYLPTGADDGNAAPSNGKVGVAFIQEHRFTERCKRHQRQISPTFDKEFKIFLKQKGITVDNSMFRLEFTAPQNFSEYRQIELDSARAAVFNLIAEIPFISRQYAMKRYLGWSELDMMENERLWRMENPNNTLPSGGHSGGSGGMGGMGGDVGLGQVGMSGSDFENDEFGGEEFADVGSEETPAEEPDVSQDDVENFGEE